MSQGGGEPSAATSLSQAEDSGGNTQQGAQEVPLTTTMSIYSVSACEQYCKLFTNPCHESSEVPLLSLFLMASFNFKTVM